MRYRHRLECCGASKAYQVLAAIILLNLHLDALSLPSFALSPSLSLSLHLLRLAYFFSISVVCLPISLPPSLSLSFLSFALLCRACFFSRSSLFFSLSLVVSLSLTLSRSFIALLLSLSLFRHFFLFNSLPGPSSPSLSLSLSLALTVSLSYDSLLLIEVAGSCQVLEERMEVSDVIEAAKRLAPAGTQILANNPRRVSGVYLQRDTNRAAPIQGSVGAMA